MNSPKSKKRAVFFSIFDCFHNFLIIWAFHNFLVFHNVRKTFAKLGKNWKICKLAEMSKSCEFWEIAVSHTPDFPPPHLKSGSEAIFCTFGAQRRFFTMVTDIFLRHYPCEIRKVTSKATKMLISWQLTANAAIYTFFPESILRESIGGEK